MNKINKAFKTVLLLLALLPSCVRFNENTSESDSKAGGETSNTVAGDFAVKELFFDDGTPLVEVVGNVYNYTVKIPAGHPRIPRISVEPSAETEITYRQAVIPADGTRGTGTVTLNNGIESVCYSVVFEKDPSLGLVYQYDDRIDFSVDDEDIIYESSDTSVAVVDSHGTVTIVGIGDSGAVVTARKGSDIVSKLTIDKTVRAPLNVFFVTGQSNAEGTMGTARDSVKPCAGTAYVMTNQNNSIGSLENGYPGFGSSIAASWFEMTGEKSLMVQTAVSGSSVSLWVKGGAYYVRTVQKMNYIREMFSGEESGYEINRVACFWLQGEFDIGNHMSSEEYYVKFLKMYNGFKKDLGMTFLAVIPVRCYDKDPDILPESLETGLMTDMVPVRAAQYAVQSAYNDIFFVTRLPESATVANGMMSPDNLHYCQSGYNKLGHDIADNLFDYLCGLGIDCETSLQVLGYDGRKCYADCDTLALSPSQTVQIVGVVLPFYANDKSVSYKSSDASVFSVDAFGLITVCEDTAGKEAELFISGGGHTIVLNISVS
ncbi:MAG: hypothetical protein J5563_04730 [Clostridia bacterium]|nr:hypothetical protein [Clostridia bacterium]